MLQSVRDIYTKLPILAMFKTQKTSPRLERTMYNAMAACVQFITKVENPPPSYAEAESDAAIRWITQCTLHCTAAPCRNPLPAPGRQTFLTSNSRRPTNVNCNVSPSLSSLAAQKPAKPFVNEQNLCFWLACVAVFTNRVESGPMRK